MRHDLDMLKFCVICVREFFLFLPYELFLYTVKSSSVQNLKDPNSNSCIKGAFIIILRCFGRKKEVFQHPKSKP